MLFNSAIFAVFILIVFPLYALSRGTSFARVVLLVASYAFYANWDVRYLPLLWISTLVDYTAGRRMAASDDPRTRRLWLLASLSTNLGLLGIFKYGNFLLETASPVWTAIGVDPPMLPGGIPVGISFYTFQTLSYTIDVYRRQLEPCDRPIDFAVFVAFFPQLVAGPIVRASELLPQLRKLPPIRGEEVAAGMQRFALGLMKKVVIADNVGLFVDQVFAAPSEYSAFTLWFAAYGFALQIYCDFSGYTDMAIGLGRAFGLRIPENFNVPYLAVSITDFWRKWHMTLSRWLRDYLYIPLGGSRGSQSATYRNLMITMLLGGLWHGAAWTFVLWGALHGAWLAIARVHERDDDGAREEDLGPVRLVHDQRLTLQDFLIELGDERQDTDDQQRHRADDHQAKNRQWSVTHEFFLLPGSSLHRAYARRDTSASREPYRFISSAQARLLSPMHTRARFLFQSSR